MSPLRPVIVQLALNPVDFRAYTRAARRLARIMGASAPDLAALLRHELHGRNPRSIAEEYLYFVGWPAADPVRVPGKPTRAKRRGR